MSDEAKRARKILEDIEPAAVDAIDAVRGAFGGRLVYLRVESAQETIEIGTAPDTSQEITPARYLRPDEQKEEWADIKDEIWSRDSARDRASGRRYQRVGTGAQVPSNTEMEI